MDVLRLGLLRTPDRLPYELFWKLEGIERRTIKVMRLQRNGFVQRLRHSLLDEDFRIKGRTKWYESVDEMQKDLRYILGVLQYQATAPGQEHEEPHPSKDFHGWVEELENQGYKDV